MTTLSLLLGAATCLVAAAGVREAVAGQPLDASQAEIRTRLGDPERLTPEEIARVSEAIARTMRGRTIVVTDGTDSSIVDANGQAILFAVLGGQLPVADLGFATIAGRRLRGLQSPATPPRSEVAAKQTLWIDPDALLPRRFEFRYEVPGLGDITYDIRLE